MERKTKVSAEDGSQELFITREFDLPVALLFTAHMEPDIFEQWMSHEYGTTKVVKWENHKLGGWRFHTTNSQGDVVFAAHGVFHDIIPNEKIVRTFEMENASFDVQLEFLEFEKLTDTTSRLTMQTVFKSAALRNQLLKMPFAQGLNMAHHRLQNILSKINNGYEKK